MSENCLPGKLDAKTFLCFILHHLKHNLRERSGLQDRKSRPKRVLDWKFRHRLQQRHATRRCVIWSPHIGWEESKQSSKAWKRRPDYCHTSQDISRRTFNKRFVEKKTLKLKITVFLQAWKLQISLRSAKKCWSIYILRYIKTHEKSKHMSAKKAFALK